MSKLVERLKAFEGSDELGNDDFGVVYKASGEIARLEAELDASQARVKALEEALMPFKDLANVVFKSYKTSLGTPKESRSEWPDTVPVWGFNGALITDGDLRRARDVLEGKP